MRASTLVLAATLLLTGCADVTEISDEVLADAKQRWADNGPPSYTLTLLRLCTCLGPQGPITVEVRNRIVVSRAYPDGTPLESQYASEFPDVPGLFLFVDVTRARRPFEWTVGYNSTYGYPTTVRVNYDPVTTADDYGYIVNEMVPVP
ncbi:MAG: DUF6174 domain-containing protein [Gemmatimonadota bacterium]